MGRSTAQEMAVDSGTRAKLELLRQEITDLQRLLDAREAREQQVRAPESPGYDTSRTMPSPDRDLDMDRDD